MIGMYFIYNYSFLAEICWCNIVCTPFFNGGQNLLEWGDGKLCQAMGGLIEVGEWRAFFQQILLNLLQRIYIKYIVACW